MSKALTFFRPDALGEVLPLYKIVETTVEVSKEEFHSIQGRSTPNKAVMDRIADASGISYLQENCGVRIEKVDPPYFGFTDLRYVGYAQGEVTEPDGTKRRSSVCEYEFDVMIRAEEEFLKSDSKYKTEIAKKKYILSLMKVARARANTGARLRVIRELTGMTTGFNGDIFKTGETITMHFKKVVANPENEMVLKAGLDNLFGSTNNLYGNAPQLEENAPKDVTPQLEGPEASNAFTREKPALSPEEQEKKELQEQIKGWIDKYSFPTEAKPFADASLSDHIELPELKKNWQLFYNHLIESGQLREEGAAI